MGRVIANLYCLDRFSFLPNVLESFNTRDVFDRYIADSYKPFLYSTQAYANSFCKDFHMWHLRLGHPSDNVIYHLPFAIAPRTTDHKCYICPMAKQTRNSFSKSVIQTKGPFVLIHIDIWGPYHTPFIYGASYFLTLVYDFTRAT